MILMAFRHGLRVKELVSMLDWHQVDIRGPDDRHQAMQEVQGH